MKDLAEVSLELLINSLEAGAQSITFDLDILQEITSLTITDDGKGMSQELIKIVTSPFTTSRSTRSLGFGLAFYKQAVEQAQGSLQITSKEGVGTTLTACWKTQHIDALPLGNLGETIAFVLQRSPTCHLHFHLKDSTKSYDFISEDIASTLHPVPLDTPEVLTWIINTINTQL